MDDTFDRFLTRAPFEAQVPRYEIRVARAPIAAGPRAAIAGAPLITRWGVNEERNARIPLVFSKHSGSSPVLPTLDFHVPIPRGVFSRELLYASDRIVVGGRGTWALFDTAGTIVGSNGRGAGMLSLNREGNQLITSNVDGALGFWSLSGGVLQQTAKPKGGRDQDRSFVTNRGSKVIIVSHTISTNPHAPVTQQSMIEQIDISKKNHSANLKNFITKSSTLLTAMKPDEMILATHDRIYFLDPNLEFKKAWTGSFLPLAMSIDEVSNVYLLVRVGAQQIRMWKLTPEAELAWDIPVPSAFTMPLQPPVVGLDHTVYLVSMRQAMAISPAGRVLWQIPIAGSIQGAIVTADDQLLVSEGSRVTALNIKGERQTVFDFGESLATPPVLATDQRLYVASHTQLFRLRLPR